MSTDLVRTGAVSAGAASTSAASASVITNRADLPAAGRRGSGQAGTELIRGGESEVLPCPAAAARPSPSRPAPGRPGRRFAGTRTQAPTTQVVGVTFAVLPTATTAPAALATRPGDGTAPQPAPPPPTRVVIGSPPELLPSRPASDLVRRPAGDLTLRPSSDLAARPGSDLAARPGSGLAARPGGELVPRPAGDLTLRATGDPTRRPGGDLARRPTSGIAADRGRSGTPSWSRRLTGRLLELARGGQARARGLTAQDKRVLAYLAVALVVALGGQTDPAAQAPTPAATAAVAALPAGAQVAATAQVLALADAQVGTVEARDGSTPYHRDYGLPSREPWCAVFVWDVFRDAGGADSIHPKTAFTPTLAGWFRDRGQWSATPAVGALVFYDWPGDRLDRIQHVGIVESFTDTTITTIEGNTSNSTFGSQDDGDGVWRRTRPRDDSVVGYGLPIYGLAA